jgi:hypothetical protein
MKKSLLVLPVLAALATPGVAPAARGVVVKVDRGGKVAAVAQTRGEVALVHAGNLSGARVGSRVSFTGRALANGTVGTSAIRVLGHAKRVHVRGVVVAKRHNGFVLSAHGALLKITKARAARSTASANDTTVPPIGSSVDVEVDTDDDSLDATSVQILSATTDAGMIRGKLTIGTGSVTIADDGVSLTFAVPAGFDLSKFQNGDKVLAFFLRNTDGTLALKVLAGDANAREADDDDEQEDDNDDDDQHDGGHDDGDNHDEDDD